ncbi:hypothetical protein [Ferrimonas marina]|uniref:Uncharacterized protein n=2 Tax=Ferrimonas marina TaxID=299255 RepID=A0A1M5TVP3_9GAMM|nr:hypothetical protein [Ferrimonas marina]SHH54857.1 hypothetical protein SAMN02745129_2297 [Ferrimonas marina]
MKVREFGLCQNKGLVYSYAEVLLAGGQRVFAVEFNSGKDRVAEREVLANFKCEVERAFGNPGLFSEQRNQEFAQVPAEFFANQFRPTERQCDGSTAYRIYYTGDEMATLVDDPNALLALAKQAEYEGNGFALSSLDAAGKHTRLTLCGDGEGACLRKEVAEVGSYGMDR